MAKLIREGYGEKVFISKARVGTIGTKLTIYQAHKGGRRNRSGSNFLLECGNKEKLKKYLTKHGWNVMN